MPPVVLTFLGVLFCVGDVAVLGLLLTWQERAAIAGCPRRRLLRGVLPGTVVLLALLLLASHAAHAAVVAAVALQADDQLYRVHALPSWPGGASPACGSRWRAWAWQCLSLVFRAELMGNYAHAESWSWSVLLLMLLASWLPQPCQWFVGAIPVLTLALGWMRLLLMASRGGAFGWLLPFYWCCCACSYLL